MRLSPNMLAAPQGADEPEMLEALGRAQNDVASSIALPISVLLLVATVLWWPLDAWVLPSHFGGGFQDFRIRAVAVELVSVGAFVFSPWARAHASTVGPLLFSIWLALVGDAIGGIPSEDVSALANAWMGVVTFSLVPQRLLVRIGWALGCASGLAFAYFGLHPEKLALPGATMQLSFGAFAVVLTVALGEMNYRLFRYGIYQQRARDKANSKLEALTGSLASAVDAKTAQLRELATHLTRVQESERLRVARDLHDDLGQNLTALRYSIARIEKHVQGDAAIDLLDDISAVLDGTFATVRGVLSELRPRILDDLGLVDAIAWATERLSAGGELVATCDVSDSAKPLAARLSSEASLALYRVVQEASTNAIRHGKAKRLTVSMTSEDHTLALRVEDNGEGFDPAVATTGFGLLGLRERMIAVGGELVIDSARGSGTKVLARVSVPTDPQSPAAA